MSGGFLSIGECMLELSQAEAGRLRKSFAGDTYNTAWYARACLPPEVPVEYLTALGTDALSDEMLAAMSDAGVGTAHVRRIEGVTPGLYLITLKGGERSFLYWRSESAARRLADDPAHLRRAIEGAGVVYFSGITLGILPEGRADALLDELGRARQAGKVVAFDPNIRAALWPDAAQMRHLIGRGAEVSSHVLPAFDDERQHFGDADPEATARRYRGLGAQVVVVKNGAGEILLQAGESLSRLPTASAPLVVDTTAAGDSFNGAFLAGLMGGQPVAAAAARAARVAAAVIGHHGALVERSLLPLPHVPAASPGGSAGAPAAAAVMPEGAPGAPRAPSLANAATPAVQQLETSAAAREAQLLAILARQPVVPVLTIEDPATAVPLARALVSGGLFALEVTLRTPAALIAIRAIAREVPTAVPGAGTVLDGAQFRAAEQAGARFIVSPGATPELLDAAATAQTPLLPGAATASEVMALRARGCSVLKFFPAEQAGGAGWLRALSAPLAGVRFCPTGGITAANAPAYLALPNVVCVGGSWLAPPALVAAGNWDEITRLARQATALGR